MSHVHVSQHPLVLHKLSVLRDKETDHRAFRELVRELALLLTYEATLDLPLQPKTVTTPMGEAKGHNGLLIDDKALSQFLELAKEHTDGIKVRFGQDHDAGASDIAGILKKLICQQSLMLKVKLSSPTPIFCRVGDFVRLW